MKSLKLILLGLTLFHVACHSQPAPLPPSTGGPLVQWSGAYSDVKAPATRTLKTEAEWDAFWKQAQREKPRPLDLAREMAVAIFLGERRTGGYTVEIASAGARDGKWVVHYRELAPPPGGMVTQALTQPWAVAIVPRSDLPVVFEKMPATRPQRPE
jgi:hypothetical protein